MTCQGGFALPPELLEQIALKGFDFLPELMRIVVNAAMEMQRQQYLSAASYQQTAERRAYVPRQRRLLPINGR